MDTAALDPAHVTVHPGGPAEELVRSMPVGEPAGHAAFEPWLHRTVSARYVLDVRDGLLVGDYAATVAPGGVLDYETSGYFGISGWREHPLFLRPRLPEPRPVPGTLLSLATRGTTTNYYHFLTDLLPRWGIFEEAMPGTRWTRSTWAPARRTSGSCWSWSGWARCRWSRSTSTPAWRRSGCSSRRRRTRT